MAVWPEKEVAYREPTDSFEGTPSTCPLLPLSQGRFSIPGGNWVYSLTRPIPGRITAGAVGALTCLLGEARPPDQPGGVPPRPCPRGGYGSGQLRKCSRRTPSQLLCPHDTPPWPHRGQHRGGMGKNGSAEAWVPGQSETVQDGEEENVAGVGVGAEE